MAVTDIDNNARSNATAGSYGAPMFLYALTMANIGTTPDIKDSNLSGVLACIGQWTTVIGWAPGASGVAYALCEGGVDLTTATPGTALAGTVTAAEGGIAASLVLTKHVDFA